MLDRSTLALLSLSGVALLGASLFGFAAVEPKPVSGQSASQQTGVSADESLSRLEAGNRRCVGGESSHEHNLPNWRERFLAKQRRFATILACSDSCVPPELLFDQGFGDPFVVRVAGNPAGADVIKRAIKSGSLGHDSASSDISALFDRPSVIGRAALFDRRSRGASS
jgi:hypothetical protein